MVSSPGVLLTARRRVRHVEVSPIADVLQRLAVEVHAGSSGLVTLAHIPFVANVAGRELPLLLFLVVLVALVGWTSRLGLGGLALHVGPRPYKVVPISGQLPSCEEAFPVSPVV